MCFFGISKLSGLDIIYGFPIIAEDDWTQWYLYSNILLFPLLREIRVTCINFHLIKCSLYYFIIYLIVERSNVPFLFILKNFPTWIVCYFFICLLSVDSWLILPNYDISLFMLLSCGQCSRYYIWLSLSHPPFVVPGIFRFRDMTGFRRMNSLYSGMWDAILPQGKPFSTL
jgi:hypothetical protein